MLKISIYEWCERERQRERRLLSRLIFGRLLKVPTMTSPAAAGRDPVIPIIVGIRVVDSSLLCCHANFAGVYVASVGLCV